MQSQARLSYLELSDSMIEPNSQAIRNRALQVTVAIALVVACAVAIYFLRPKPSPNSIQVAANLPLSGGLAVYGEAVKNGAIMAVDDLRESHLDSLVIEIDWQDNAGNPQAAVSIMQQHYLRPPDIYVSGVRPQTMAIWEQISEQGTPHFVWIFEMYVNANRKAGNNLRTWVNFKIEPEAYLAYVDRHSPKKVAILHSQLPSTHDEFTKLVIPGLKKRGINDLLVEPFDFEMADFKPLAIKVRNYKPDIIILSGFQSHLVALVRAMRPFGLITADNTIATYDMLDAVELLGPDEIEGIRVAAPHFVTRPDRPEVARWRERYKSKYDKEPLYTDAFAYDMIYIIHDAASRLQRPATSDQWIKALRATDAVGITGPLKFDDDGSLITPVEVGVFRNGKIIPDDLK